MQKRSNVMPKISNAKIAILATNGFEQSEVVAEFRTS